MNGSRLRRSLFSRLPAHDPCPGSGALTNATATAHRSGGGCGGGCGERAPEERLTHRNGYRGIEARFLAASAGGGNKRASVDVGALRWTQASFLLPPQLLARFQYAYDPVGNPLQVVRTGVLSETRSYAYDAMDRLSEVCFSAALCTVGRLRYTYDQVGNRLTGGSLGYTYDARDRLLEVSSGGIAPPPVTYSYDANGNLRSASDGSRLVFFAYDLANRLRTVSAPPTLRSLRLFRARASERGRELRLRRGGRARFAEQRPPIHALPLGREPGPAPARARAKRPGRAPPSLPVRKRTRLADGAFGNLHLPPRLPRLRRVVSGATTRDALR